MYVPVVGMGAFLDDVGRIAGAISDTASKARVVIGQASGVLSGTRRVAVVPRHGVSVVGGEGPLALGVGLVPLGLGALALWALLARKRG